VSGPPFSQFMLAPLARAGGLGVVLDYRDEWLTARSTYEMSHAPAMRALGDKLEAALLRCAHAVVTATEEFRANLLARFPFVDPHRVVAIPNGYDPDDFPSELPPPPTDRFVVTYAGTVFKLTRARGFLRAVRKLHERNPELARHLRVRFVGRIVETERAEFEGMEALGVETADYVPHDEVLRRLAASHLTLCLLDDVAGADRILPGKIFELMHLGRPVLALTSEHGALGRLVARHALGPVVHPSDESRIAAVLEERIRQFRCGGSDAVAWRKAPGTERYHRRALAAEFAQILRRAAFDAGRRGSWIS
jgi:glycosyltransferase involved in cell wall biosynthesis